MRFFEQVLRPEGCRGTRFRGVGGAVTLVLGLLVGTSATGEGFTPEESRDRMALPEGFSATVFASEPELVQPVGACFDERGRMWVIEYLQYPNPAGLKPVEVDVYLRTKYDRVPEPPPHGPRGADRIKILEDTNGDGRADTITTFLEGLNLASGLAVGHGGLFVVQAPYLLFYPDRNGDDVPDGDPEVLLEGFGLEDAHAVANSLIWGPDGWLYGAQGSTVTADIRGIGFQQGIWRYHPITKAFELFAEGGGNTWGLDFDRTGHAFGSSNGSFIMFHMVQGGYYWKGFAKHGPLHNPHAYGYFESAAYHGPKHGGHVTPGGLIYKEDAFPTEFHGAFIGGDLLSNAVHWHTLEPKGSTVSARHGGTLIEANDPWFRPIDLKVGPDGAVYVLDWHDQRASHLDPRDNWDRTNGRIFKITYGEGRTVEPFDLSQQTSEELVALQAGSSDWFAAEARRILAERRDPSVIPGLKAMLQTSRDETFAARALWSLYVSGGLDDATAGELLDHPAASVRRWTVRLLGDEHRMTPSLLARLITLAESEPDSQVRSQLASSGQRWDPTAALAILEPLLQRSEDRSDPHIPLLLWWAIEQQLRNDREAVVAFLSRPEIQSASLVREVVLERTARALASQARDEDFAACARLLEAAPSEAEVARLVIGTEKGLEGRRLDAVPPALEEPFQRLWSRPDPDASLMRFALRLGSASAQRTALERVINPSAPEAERLALIEVLGQRAGPESLPVLIELFQDDENPTIRTAVLQALGHYTEPEVADTLLEKYTSLDTNIRDRVRDLLCSRRPWARRLLVAIERGAIATTELRVPQAQRVVQLGEESLTEQLERVWGRVPTSNSPEKLQRIAEIRGVLPEGDKGRAERGRPVFEQHCATCHTLFGEGEEIGPDLTGTERGNLDFLLTSIIDPSAVIRNEYMAFHIALVDGRVLTGLVVDETDTTLTVIDDQQERTVIAREDIEEMKPSDVSLMPEGLLDDLTDDQVRDLFRYLQSSGK